MGCGSAGSFFLLLFLLRTWNQNFFFAYVRENSPVQPLATEADNLIFFDNFVAAVEGEATEAAMMEVVSAATLTATAGPLATAAA